MAVDIKDNEGVPARASDAALDEAVGQLRDDALHDVIDPASNQTTSSTACSIEFTNIGGMLASRP